jgi:hypothetical protein
MLLYGRWFRLALCGVFWRERNDLSFEDHEWTMVELYDLFFKTPFHWAVALCLNISSFHVFLDLLSSAS